MCETINFFLISHWLSHSGFSFRVSYWRSLSRQWWSPLSSFDDAIPTLTGPAARVRTSSLGACQRKILLHQKGWRKLLNLKNLPGYKWKLNLTVSQILYVEVCMVQKKAVQSFFPHSFMRWLDSRLLINWVWAAEEINLLRISCLSNV